MERIQKDGRFFRHGSEGGLMKEEARASDRHAGERQASDRHFEKSSSFHQMLLPAYLWGITGLIMIDSMEPQVGFHAYAKNAVIFFMVSMMLT